MKKKYIVTYDVHRDHERIIQDLITAKWHSVIKGVSDDGQAVICYLPETTWWKEFFSSKAAFDELKSIAGDKNVIRITVSAFEDWRSSTNNPMKHQIEEVKRLHLIIS